jgi:hypothetical protein
MKRLRIGKKTEAQARLEAGMRKAEKLRDVQNENSNLTVLVLKVGIDIQVTESMKSGAAFHLKRCCSAGETLPDVPP